MMIYMKNAVSPSLQFCMLKLCSTGSAPLGSLILTSFSPSSGPPPDIETDDAFLGKMSRLEVLEIGNMEMTDISFLESMPQLKRLSLEGNSLTEIASIASCRNLSGPPPDIERLVRWGKYSKSWKLFISCT